ncbi:DHH family protein [Streptococcus pneumoniae]|nr:DHH family protein [Streptococcus pneumoniae]
MKKFYVSPIFPILVGLIAFGVLSTFIIFVNNNLLTVLILFLFVGGYVFLFKKLRVHYTRSDVEQIQYVNHQAEESLTSLLEQMPVGVMKLNLSSGEVEWFNPYAELILTKEDGDFDLEAVQTIIKASVGNPSTYAKLGEKRYAVHMDASSGVLYFVDVSREQAITDELVTSRPVIGIVSVDNYDDLEDATSESDISQINSFVANFISEFSEKYMMFSRRVSMD